MDDSKDNIGNPLWDATPQSETLSAQTNAACTIQSFMSLLFTFAATAANAAVLAQEDGNGVGWNLAHGQEPIQHMK